MKRLTALLLLTAIYLNLVSSMVVRGQDIAITLESKMKDTPPGLSFRLSEGTPGAESRVKPPLPATDPLSETDLNGVLKRLSPIKSDPADEADFLKRVATLPAPKSGRQIPIKFPSDGDRGLPRISAAEGLDVLRFSPEGEVSLAPDLSITFSQPMVAVTSQEDAAKYAPVELSPQVEGRWRWLGTKTLMFDTAKRFPMATKFTARVPAGTKSANGEALAKDFSWTFTTPPPKVEQMIPANQIVRRDALMFVSFDQAIDPEAVLRTISLTSGARQIRARLATQQEIDADQSIVYYTKQSERGRWLVFRAVNEDSSVANALPPASPITVTIEKGTPSAEGPLTTTEAQVYSFQTFSPLKFIKAYCGWEQKPNCSPFDPWYIQFNNSLEGTSLSKEMVTIEPAIEGARVYASGNYIYVEGYKKGRTSYKITVDSGLKDVFGQDLGQPVSTTIKVGSAEQTLYSQGRTMAVLDPTATPSYSIYSTNHSSVKVRMYVVRPEDWHQFLDFVRHMNYDDGNRPPIPGRLVSDRIISIQNKPDEMVETRIDISPALDGGLGSVILDVEPTIRKDKYDRTRIVRWLLSTQMGLDAFVDNQELIGFATDLKTGKPLSGVDLSVYPNGTAVRGGSLAENQPGSGSWWDWFWSWGSSQTDEIEASDQDSETIESETIAEAQTNRTGENGILRLPLVENGPRKGQSMLIAKRGKDVAFLPENSEYYWQDYGSWYRKPDSTSLRWFVFDDRKMYRPKEEVAVKGYIRRMTGGKFSDVEALGDSATGITYSVKDSRNNEIAKGTANLNSFGAFDLKFTLPDNANLGYSRIDLSTSSSLSGESYSHQFQIQEFRRPEFEVSAKVETEAPHFVGGNAMLSVEAKYFAGGGLPNAETNWTVTATPTNYAPPNRGDYTFGTWVPWWGIYEYGDLGGYRGRGYGGITQSFKGVTDASGKHLLKIDFESVNPPRPYNVSASASVQDVNRQTWAASTSLLVHPSSLYVGIKTPRTFVQKGEKIDIESIVTDIDGNLVDGNSATVKAVLKDWTVEKGVWKEVVIDEQLCTVRSAQSAQKCTFVAKQGGRYTITATVMDDRERFNESELVVWVPGGKTPPKRNVEQEQVQIIPSKKDYAPGEVAELLVVAPFAPAEGVLTLRREGLVKTERFSMKDSSVTLKIPLEERYLPNIYAQVDLVGAAARTNDQGEVDPKLSKRPAFASGSMNLSISTATRKLSVSAEPRDKTLVPGGETKVDVVVKDSKGAPVANSEVAVVVVDESVLALSRYAIGDPMDIFYAAKGSGTMDYHLRKDVLLGNPEDVKTSPPPPPPAASPKALAGETANFRSSVSKQEARKDISADAISENEAISQDPEINVRQNFNALATFSPSVRTDASGRAVIDVKLPDNLTRYRITAVSADDAKRFGKIESTITAKQPLMVRPSAPRFMNFGDRIELPVVIQNQTDKDMAVDVAVRASNAELTGDKGRRVVVRANDRAEVRFPAAAVKAGTARFQVAVTSGSYADAAEISLPVWTPATTEAFATYGTTDENVAVVQPVQAPGDVFTQFGGLEVTTSSTQLQELTDAFLYLTNYPYACSEQISSRMISIAAMRDVLAAFKSKDMPTAAELDGYFKRDVEILQSRQREDGSFGLWKRDRERYEYPFLTVHVAHALALAKAKGYKVPDEMLNRSRPFLKDIEKHFDDWHKRSPEVRWTIAAYALYVRDMMGDKDVIKAKDLLREATTEKMPFEALGWVLSVLSNDPSSTVEVASITRFLMNRTTEAAATANFVTDYGDGAWLIMYSNRRADGVLLEALIKSDPKNDLIPKLVRGLLDHRVKGAWSNTQENVFILLALDKYFNAFEKVTPDFVARIWLGGTYAGEQAFRGRSADSNILNIPMSYLAQQGGASNLILDRQGAGRLYYRIGMKYAPKDLKLQPADYGFTILRNYEAIDDPADVVQNADGSWTIKAGARVRVRLAMVAQARRYHVALVDNLPAGLEILNPELAVTESVPGDTGNKPLITYRSRSYGHGSWWWRQYWFEHQNFRDERAEAFSSLLWEGVYNYSYVTRATTPGKFVVPPAKAEEMYHPETFGRTGTDFVTIE